MDWIWDYWAWTHSLAGFMQDIAASLDRRSTIESSLLCINAIASSGAVGLGYMSVMTISWT